MRGFPSQINSIADLENLLSGAFNSDALSFLGNVSGNADFLATMGGQDAIIDVLAERCTSDNFSLSNPFVPKSLSAKGQLHCHSTGSDGSLTPTEIVTAYKDLGYDFVALTDHNAYTPDPAIAGIIFLSGNEVSYYYGHAITYVDISLRDFCHPLQYATENYPDARYWQENGLIEVNNYLQSLLGYPQGPFANAYWDSLLARDFIMWGISVDDCHHAININNGWIVVNVDVVAKADIVAAITSGNFYASNGNDISISVDGDTIIAMSTNESTFTFIGRNGYVLKTELDVYNSSYIVCGWEKYVRVEAVNSAGKYAWSQPLWIV